MTSRRPAFAACLALVFAFSATAAFSLPNPFARKSPEAVQPVKLPPGVWPQARSDLAADPNVRFGALPNGMRYALQKNATPPGQASLRLRFDAGSLMETDAQQGLAHFLEHMAFNGSKDVPEGEMVKILERLGLSFGADTNASTGFEDTVYKLDLPRTDDNTVDTSLMLLRQTAGQLTIAPEAVERERGVVLSEERAGDTPAYRIFKSQFAFTMKGQLSPKRLPIGQVEVLKTAPAAQLVDYYRRYYRPERAVLVAVGDFDLDAMEAKIKSRFGDWTAIGAAGPEPDIGPLAKRGAETAVAVDPGAQAGLQLIWASPLDVAPDTQAKRKVDLVEQLGFSVLNRRLGRLARAERPPFIGAGAFRGNQLRAGEFTVIAVSNAPDKWREALSAVEQEQRRLVQYGVRQDELDREIEEFRGALRAEAAGAATRRTPDLANGVVGSLDDNDVVTSPAQDLALFETVAKNLKAETVSKAVAASFAGQGPLVFVASPAPIAGGETSVETALETSRKIPVAAPETPREVTWPYAQFGNPGKVAEEKQIIDLETTFVRFENGVRLTVRPTKFSDDQILVSVRVGDGLAGLPADRQSDAWSSGALVEGGLKQISSEDMERVLAGKVYSANFGVRDNAFLFNGATRRDDFDVQLQVLAAYLSEPGWRPEAFARIQTAGATIHEQFEATDQGVMGRDLAGLLHVGDRRWTFPSRQEIASAKLADLQAQIAPALMGGAVEVTIVGDITVEKAVEAAAATFGALSPRPAPRRLDEAAVRVGFPAGGGPVIERVHKGRPDQATGFVAWKTGDLFADPQRARTLGVLGEVMKLRLIDELREAQGVTYSPGVNTTQSQVWTGWGYLAASVQAPPDKLPGFFQDVAKIAADLRDKEIAADELERAKKPRVESLLKQRETNDYWLSQLAGAQAEPRKLDAIRSVVASTERVGAADLRKAAATYLTEAGAWRLEVTPERK